MNTARFHPPRPSRADAPGAGLLEAGPRIFAGRCLDGVAIHEINRGSVLNSTAIACYFAGNQPQTDVQP